MILSAKLFPNTNYDSTFLLKKLYTRKTLAYLSLFVVFTADFFVPPGTAMGILYLFTLTLVFNQNRKTIISFAILSSILIITDIAFHFKTDLHYSVYGDRTLSLMAVWIMCFILLAYRRLSKEKLSKQAELAVQESKYSLLIDNLTEGAIIIDHDWRYVYVNNALVKQSRYSKTELLGSTMMEKYQGIENTELFKKLKQCAELSEPGFIETEFPYPNGGKGWFQLSVQPVAEGLFILSNDVTELRKTQESLIKEQLTREYTSQLETYKKENNESLRYAQRLQEYMMQEAGELREIFPESFVLNMAKNHVSGDFFWFHNEGDKCSIVASDCTGHGIPGAMLTILGMTILHNAFTPLKANSPSGVLKYLDQHLHRKLSRRATGRMNDGMDVTICEIDRKKMLLKVSGSNNPVYLVRNKEVQKIETDKYHVGDGISDKCFIERELKLMPGDMIYSFSDGYTDQFGGEYNKKLGSKKFRELLASVSHENAGQQLSMLEQSLTAWQSGSEQTDDILVIGIKI